DEAGGIEVRGALAPTPHVAPQQRQLVLLRHVDAGILQQRGEVVGGRSYHRVLEIEYAEAGDTFALGQPQQVWRMKIRQYPRRGPVDGALQQVAPQRAERGALGIRDGRAQPRQVPVEHELRLDQERIDVVARNAIIDVRRYRQLLGQRLAVERKEHV